MFTKYQIIMKIINPLLIENGMKPHEIAFIGLISKVSSTYNSVLFQSSALCHVDNNYILLPFSYCYYIPLKVQKDSEFGSVLRVTSKILI